MNQVHLIPSGVQPWYRGVLKSTNEKFAFASTLAIYVYSLADYSLQRVIVGHRKTISALCWSPHLPNVIASSGQDCAIRLWDTNSSTELKHISTDSMKPVSLAWSYHDQHLIACGGRGVVRLYNYATETHATIDLNNDSNVVIISFNPKIPGKFIAATTNGSVYACITSSSRAEKLDLGSQGNAAAVVDVQWDPLSDHYLLIGFQDGSLMLLDTENSTKIQEFDRVGGGLASVSWLSGIPGGFITTDSKTGVIRTWNVSQNAPIKSQQKVRDYGFNELVSVPNTQLAVCSFTDGAVGVFNFKFSKFEFLTQGSHTETVFDCQFSSRNPDILATSSYDGTIKLWDVSKMKCVDNLAGLEDVVFFSVSWHPTQNHLVASLGNGDIWLYDVDTRQVLKKFRHHKETAYKVKWNQLDPHLFASTSKDRTCIVFRDDGKVVRTLTHPNTVFGVDWSPFNKHVLATGCHDGVVRVFNIAHSESPEKELKGHTSDAFNVKWNPIIPDILLSGSNDQTVRVWNVKTGDSKSMIGHTNNVRALEWSPEVPYLAFSGSWDGTIRVWDTRIARCIYVVNYHHSDVYGLTVHPARPFFFVSSSRDTTLRFWNQEHVYSKFLTHFVDLDPTRMAEALGKPNEQFNSDPATEHKMCGTASLKLLDRLNQTSDNIEKYKQIYEFFLPPYGTRNLWDLLNCHISGKPSSGCFDVLHMNVQLDVMEAKAKELQSVKRVGAGSRKRADCLKEAAAINLKLGNMREYCEIMVELGQWERALAVAPAVSLEYWQSLSRRYAKKLSESDDADAIPFYIVNNEVDKVSNFYIMRDELNDAMLVAKAVSENRFNRVYKEDSQREEPKQSSKSATTEMCAIARLMAERYMKQAEPIWAACCFLAVGDEKRAIRMLMKGHQFHLAYSVSKMLKVVAQDEVNEAMAFFCQQCSLWDQAIEYMQQIKNNRNKVLMILAAFTGSDDERDRLYLKAGFQSQKFYAEEAPRRESGSDVPETIRSYVLARNNERAVEVGVKQLSILFSAKTWDWDAITKIIAVLNCIDAEKLSPRNKRELLIYSSFIGAQVALWRGYFTIAPKLITNVRWLIKSATTESNNNASATSFPVSSSYVDYMLCLCLAYVDKVEALTLLNQFMAKADIEPDIKEAAIRLRTKIETRNATLLEGMNQVVTNSIVPIGSSLPLPNAFGTVVRSIITKKETKAPLYYLEDNKSVISLAEAVMWFKVTPFSPLLTGRRINPYLQQTR